MFPWDYMFTVEKLSNNLNNTQEMEHNLFPGLYLCFQPFLNQTWMKFLLPLERFPYSKQWHIVFTLQHSIKKSFWTKEKMSFNMDSHRFKLYLILRRNVQNISRLAIFFSMINTLSGRSDVWENWKTRKVSAGGQIVDFLEDSASLPSSREWWTVGTLTTDCELSVILHFRQSQQKIWKFWSF